MFPEVQCEPPVFQPVPTASEPVTEHHQEEAPPLLSSLQVFTYTGETPPEPYPDLRIPALSACSPRRENLHDLSGPLLDPIQYIHVPQALGRTQLDTALQLTAHQGWEERQDHLHQLVGNFTKMFNRNVYRNLMR